MIHRRNFIKQLSVAGLLSTMPKILLSMAKPADKKIWACLLHLSFNMWEDYISPKYPVRGFRPDLRLSETLWNDALKKMVSEGMNMVVIDLGDAIKYESHPEIAVRNAWSVTKLRNELNKIRNMGLEPIPKLNFSAAHDIWLKDYSRMLTTEEYYAVCGDLIQEVSEIFDKPRFFHLGMNEETPEAQTDYNYLVVRKNDAWWGDFYFLIGEVQKAGSRPWVWSDYAWQYPELFYKNMPKTVIQSNWYYGENFDVNTNPVKTYIDLETSRFDQIPAGSYEGADSGNILATVQFGQSHITSSRLNGFLQTFWKPTIEEFRTDILKGIQLAGSAKKSFQFNVNKNGIKQ
jgi:hypothetical protein